MASRRSCWLRGTVTLELSKRSFKMDAMLVNKSAQSAHDIATFWNHRAAADSIKSFLKPRSQQLELVNYFSHQVVDRQGYKRNDKQFIDAEMVSSRARFMVFGKLQLLMRKTKSSGGEEGVHQEVVYLTWDEIRPLLDANAQHDLVFLGVGNIEKGKLLREGSVEADEDRMCYYAVNFKNEMPNENEAPCKGGYFAGKGFSGIMGLRYADSGIASQARSVLAWHDSYVFCPACGTKTEIAEAGWKRVCRVDSCATKKGAHNASFPRTDPVVIMLILSKDKKRVLLGRQGRHPPRMYSAIAGFVESGESIEDAARREAMEEVGCKVGKITYHSSQPWPFPCSLMIGLIGHAVDDHFECDKVELDDARWFDKSEVAAAYVEGFARSEGLLIPPAYAIANQLIKTWLETNPAL